MFGTLKPHACGLGCGTKRAYATFYCGLCKSLGDHFGTLSRALLNYDAVFLALVADALMEVEAKPDRCRCPMMPVTHRATVRPDSTAMRYAAAMQILLSDQWLADRAEDGKRAARAARPILSSKVDYARGILEELGVPLADLEGFEERQARCERAGGAGPREASTLTSDALARVFETMASLPGVSEAAREARPRLRELGERLGRVIYLIDALDDLEKDQGEGAFNPCLLGERVVWSRVEEAARLVDADLSAMRELLLELPLLRHQEILGNILCAELPILARRAAKKAHAFARRTHVPKALPMALAPRSFVYRFAAQLAMFFVFVWAWLSGSTAFARSEEGPADAGADAADAGDAAPPEKWNPIISDVVDPWAGDGGDSAKGDDESSGGMAKGSPEDEGDDVSSKGSSGKSSKGSSGYSPCSSPCHDCSNACSNFCTQLTKPCTECCDGCKSCPGSCNGCCNQCTGCGDGCKGCCNGGGSCCNSCGSCCR